MTPIKICPACDAPALSQSRYCEDCLDAKKAIQSNIVRLLNKHNVPLPFGKCAECRWRDADARDHRYYCQPLRVEYVCRICNQARGEAHDLLDLIKQHRAMYAFAPTVPAPPVRRLPAAMEGPLLAPLDLSSIPARIKVAPTAAIDAPAALPFNAEIDALKVRRMREALEHTRWNITKAAAYLGISFRSMRYMLKCYPEALAGRTT
jgi:hypothetical protein